jgi:hypothetical protein
VACLHISFLEIFFEVGDLRGVDMSHAKEDQSREASTREYELCSVSMGLHLGLLRFSIKQTLEVSCLF